MVRKWILEASFRKAAPDGAPLHLLDIAVLLEAGHTVMVVGTASS